MEEPTKIIVDPYRQIRVNKIKKLTQLGQKQIDDFIEVVERAYNAKNPAKEDLQAIRQFLRDYPPMSKAVFAVVESVQEHIIKNTIGFPVAEVAMEEYVVGIRDEMGYHDAPVMEKLLIENIVTAWLHVQYCESQLAFRLQGQQSIELIEFWERRLSMSHRRYLTACESLAKIRKMAIPALQLNIGDKQINVAGNLQSTPKR